MKRAYVLAGAILVLTLVLSASPEMAKGGDWQDRLIYSDDDGDVYSTVVCVHQYRGTLLAFSLYYEYNIMGCNLVGHISHDNGRTWSYCTGGLLGPPADCLSQKDLYDLISVGNYFVLYAATGDYRTYSFVLAANDGDLVNFAGPVIDYNIIYTEMPEYIKLVENNGVIYALSDPDSHILILKSQNDGLDWSIITDNDCGVDRGLDACVVWNASNNEYAILASFITAGNHLKIRRYGLTSGTWEYVHDFEYLTAADDATSIASSGDGFAFCACELSGHSIFGRYTTDGGDNWDAVALIGSGSQDNREPTVICDDTYVGIACINGFLPPDFETYAHYRRRAKTNVSAFFGQGGFSFADYAPALLHPSMAAIATGEHGVAFIGSTNDVYVSALYDCMNCSYVCGDANGDAAVYISDAVYIINYIFKGGPAPVPLEAGDANCDGTVNVSDAVYIINYVFKGGPEPCCP